MPRPIRVLYVDSDHDDADSVASALLDAHTSLDVTTETSVDSALERLSTVDCIVSAYDLPEQDGVEFLQEVRETHPHLPFILYTDQGNEQIASEAISAGVTEYCRHTDENTELAARIAETVERARSKTDASERLQVLQAILEHVPLVLGTIDESGTITRIEGNALEPAGIETDVAVGNSVSDAFDGNQDIADGFERALDGEDVTNTVEIADSVFQSWFQPLRSAGDITGVVFLAFDVTDRREKEKELERQNEQLEKFAQVVSHDLRNPLDIAMTRLELLADESDSEHIEPIATAHDRIETLIENVLTLARTGQTITDRTTVDLETVAREAWETVDTDGMTLEVDGNCQMDAEPDRLHQLFENLFRNSAEHGEPPVTVTVGAIEILLTSTRSTTDPVRGFYVADDGPGIPDDIQDDVLEWGFTTASEGTGFGLAIVAQIAETHGWEVSVMDSRDGGARFEFRGDDFRQASGW